MSDLTFSKLHTQGEKKSRQTWNKQGKESDEISVGPTGVDYRR
jgi:hypothetical protein